MRITPFLVVFGFAEIANATPKIPRDQITTIEGTPAKHIIADGNRPYTVKDATARLGLVADFEVKMQEKGACADSGKCEFGGIHEVESGIGFPIVQSDNTQQAVFLWSYQHSLDPMKDHQQQITNAFEYLALNPGWLEWMDGGGTAPDYYSLYNCGWGIRAVLAYEAATKDMSHHMYGVMCAQHVAMYGPNLAKGTDIIDVATAGWGGSALWQWSHAMGDSAGEQTAANIGASIKAWIEAKPARLAFQSWAVTGGSTFDAVVNTYMKAHPDELGPWVQQMAPMLGGWVDESVAQNPNDWTDWRNAHNGWNMLAQFDAANALTGTDADDHRQLALEILDKLWMQDDDSDGAIPGSQQRPNTEDESWITAYFTVFGVRQLFDLPMPMPDAGPQPMDDAGIAPDGGTKMMNSGGCSCDTPQSGGHDPRAAFLFAAIVAACRFRKMRARSSRARGAASAER